MRLRCQGPAGPFDYFNAKAESLGRNADPGDHSNRRGSAKGCGLELPPAIVAGGANRSPAPLPGHTRDRVERPPVHERGGPAGPLAEIRRISPNVAPESPPLTTAGDDGIRDVGHQ